MAKKSSSKDNLSSKFENIQNYINLNGVKTHNLKDIDVQIPKNQITTITGVSGSGKSSLAFDTIYKEGQYRYIESLSSYLRQFFNLGERPDVDFCQGLSPAIAIEQNKRVGNSRSTVGTLTEIDDYIRLLYSKLGSIYCYGCGKEIKVQNVDTIVKNITKIYNKKKIYLLKSSGKAENQKELEKYFKKNRNLIEKGKGFSRFLVIDGQDSEVIEYFYLENPNIPNKFFPVDVYGIYDRVTITQERIPRLKEDIIKILAEAKKFGIYTENSKKKQEIERFTDKSYCPSCDITYPKFTPQHFSFNRQEGACKTCHGIGEILQVDFDKLIDPYSTYLQAILPWRDSMYGKSVLKKIAYKYDILEETLWKDLPERFQHIVLYGDNELLRVSTGGGKYVSLKYEGIEDIIKQQYAKGLLTVDFQAMLGMKVCPACNGAKLAKESLFVFLKLNKKYAKDLGIDKTFLEESIDNKQLEYAKPVNDGYLKLNITDLQKIELNILHKFLDLYQTNSQNDKILTARIINPLIDRVATIIDLGLGYINCYRQIGTLSGGEIQRLRLAKQLGNKLTGIIYVLDEPTIGLSQKEIKKAINSIQTLKAMGNTVIVVEHNEDFIKASDRIVEIGPHAGDFGGKVIYTGPYKDFLKSNSLTSKYIKGDLKINVDFTHKPNSSKIIRINKANKYNLQNIDIQIKLGSFCVLTGPSGAGKTTLMYTTLYRFLNDKHKFVQGFIRYQLLKKGRDWKKIISAPVINKEEYSNYENIAIQEFHKDLQVESIKGHEQIKNIIFVDQSSIGKTPRSCPATFIGVFDKIRHIFAGTKQAKYLGFNSGHFSFNSKKGACPACNGYGYKKVELQFLPDTYVPCELCNGKRYKSEILSIKRNDYNIADILEMYISDAIKIFTDIDHIHEQLQLMVDIGLGYLKMGQPAHTLSGGESQRLKLVKHLLKSYKGHTMYFLDEPTVGLHPQDIEKLLLVLKKFLDNNDTIMMIEHDKNILQFADQIINLEDGKVT